MLNTAQCAPFQNKSPNQHDKYAQKHRNLKHADSGQIIHGDFLLFRSPEIEYNVKQSIQPSLKFILL